MSLPFVLISATGSPSIDIPIALQFAEQYPIALLCDDKDDIEELSKSMEEREGECVIFRADVNTTDYLPTSIAAIIEHFGNTCAAAIFQMRNESSITSSSFIDQTSQFLRQDAILPITSSYVFAQHTIPLLLNHIGGGSHPPTLLFSGPFKSSYFNVVNNNALTALSRSLGREFGKKGIHVCLVKFQNNSETTQLTSNAKDPLSSAITETFWMLHTQPLNCFSNEIAI